MARSSSPSAESGRTGPVGALLVWGTLAAGCAPSGPASPFRTDPSLVSDIEAARSAADLPGLSIGLLEAGEHIWTLELGLLDVQGPASVESSTPFLTASVSKTVVGLAAARMASSGIADLDEPIHATLGDGFRHPSGQPYTLRQLLTHTAGVADDWDTLAEGYVLGDSPIALRDWVDSYFLETGASYDAQRNFVPTGPGGERVYSNAGVALAAAVLQQHADQPFDDWCAEELFVPLGLSHTGWHLEDLEAEAIAQPHLRTAGGLQPIPHYGVPDWPNGQLRSSARDLTTLVASVARPGLHPPGTLEILFEIPFPALDDRQALTWLQRDRGGRARVWTHGGSEMGAAAELVFDPLTGDAIVLLANTDKDDLTRDALRTIAERAFRSLERGR